MVINKFHNTGIKVILKPTVNFKDGTWRAHINFFDIDVPCEPKWSDWFKSYDKFIAVTTYNTDKYQEDQVKWWDAIDVISSSGYYPINDWDNQLKRIQKVVEKYNKPSSL